jgi:tRNA threonylcarbamoyladenosine biosynthesis protein TsaE
MKPQTITTKKTLHKLAKQVEVLVKQGVKHSVIQKKAFIIALSGDLGTGKTTFTKELATLFHVKQNVVSPTFMIFRSYSIPRQKGIEFTHLYHVDLYRIEHIDELKILEFNKILENPHYIVIIEWAEKIKDQLPKNALWIYFKHGKRENERILAFGKK